MRLPISWQTSLLEQILIEVDDATISAIGNTIQLILIGHNLLYRGIDLTQARPFRSNVLTDDCVERLDIASIGEFAHPNTVDTDDVCPATGVQSKRDLGLVWRVVHTVRVEGDFGIYTLLLLCCLKLRNDILGYPVCLLGVLTP